jgi:hypothetical protein
MLKVIEKVDEDGMAVLATWQVEACEVSRGKVYDPKVGVLFVDVVV